MADVLESVQSTLMETVSFLKDLVENFAEFVSVNFQTHVQDRLKMLLENKNESDQEMMDPRSNNNKKDQLFKLATQVFCRDIACRMMEFLDVKSMVRLSSVCQSAHQSLAIEVQRRKDRVSAIEVKIQDLLNGPQEHHQDVDDDASTSSSFYQPTKDQFEEALVLQQEARTWIDSGLGWLDHEYDPDYDPSFHLREEGAGEEQPCPICSCDTLFGDIRISKMKCHSQEQVVTHGLAILPKVFYTALQDKIIIESVHLSHSGEDASLSPKALKMILLRLWVHSLQAVHTFHEDEPFERTDAAFYYDPDHTLRLFGPDAAGGSTLEDSPLAFYELLVFQLSQVLGRVSMVSLRSVAREFVQSHPDALPLMHCVLMTAERGLVNMIVGMIENHMTARRTSIEDVDEGAEDSNEDGDDEFFEHDSDDGYYAEEDGDESEWEDEYEEEEEEEEEDDECEDEEEDEASASSEMDAASGSSSEASSADHGDEEGDL